MALSFFLFVLYIYFLSYVLFHICTIISFLSHIFTLFPFSLHIHEMKKKKKKIIDKLILIFW